MQEIAFGVRDMQGNGGIMLGLQILDFLCDFLLVLILKMSKKAVNGFPEAKVAVFP